MTRKILLSTLVAVLIVAGYQYWQLGKLQAKVDVLIANNTVLDGTVKTQYHTITTLQTHMANVIKNNAALVSAQAKIRQESHAAITALQNYKGRLNHAALKKPTLIEQRVNTAFSDVMQQFTAATDHQNNTR